MRISNLVPELQSCAIESFVLFVTVHVFFAVSDFKRRWLEEAKACEWVVRLWKDASISAAWMTLGGSST